MKKAVRIALGSAALATGLAFAGASPANAQVRFQGSFPLPHGRISVGVGGGGLSIGSYVPERYSVYEDPDYGYGFYDGDQWFSCEQNGSRWIIVERPVYYANRGYRSVRPYRNHGYRYSQPYRNNNRSFGNRSFGNRSHDNRSFDNRSSRNRSRDSGRSGRDDRQSRERGRRGNR